MFLHPTTLLSLLLCLGQTIHMKDEVLPRPSICAKPNTVVPSGQPVTIVCQSPAGAEIFRLERRDQITDYKDQTKVPQHGSQETEARFHIAASKAAAGRYFCRYYKGKRWSDLSELLELVVTDEDISTLPSGPTKVVSSTLCTYTKSPSSAGLSTERVYILSGISVAFLLCLLLLVILLVHRLCQKKHGPLSSKGEKQSPQERFSPAVDIIQRTPDVSIVGKLSKGERELHALSPAADPEEVTYAQLDHRVLTLRAAGAQSLQSTEPTADASMYAALAGR